MKKPRPKSAPATGEEPAPPLSIEALKAQVTAAREAEVQLQEAVDLFCQALAPGDGFQTTLPAAGARAALFVAVSGARAGSGVHLGDPEQPQLYVGSTEGKALHVSCYRNRIWVVAEVLPELWRLLLEQQEDRLIQLRVRAENLRRHAAPYL